MSYQYSSTTPHSDETYLESFLESLVNASLPSEFRRNLEHLKELDGVSGRLMEEWREGQDGCLRGVEGVLVRHFKKFGGRIGGVVDGENVRDDGAPSGGTSVAAEGSGDDGAANDSSVGGPKRKRKADSSQSNKGKDLKKSSKRKKVEKVEKMDSSDESMNGSGKDSSGSDENDDKKDNDADKGGDEDSENDSKDNDDDSSAAPQQQQNQKKNKGPYVPSTEEIRFILKNNSRNNKDTNKHNTTNNTSKNSNDDDNNNDDEDNDDGNHKYSNFNFETEYNKLKNTYHDLQNYSLEKIQTAKQIRSMVDMALGRLDRDLEKFERQLRLDGVLGVVGDGVGVAGAAGAGGVGVGGISGLDIVGARGATVGVAGASGGLAGTAPVATTGRGGSISNIITAGGATNAAAALAPGITTTAGFTHVPHTARAPATTSESRGSGRKSSGAASGSLRRTSSAISATSATHASAVAPGISRSYSSGMGGRGASMVPPPIVTNAPPIAVSASFPANYPPHAATYPATTSYPQYPSTYPATYPATYPPMTHTALSPRPKPNLAAIQLSPQTNPHEYILAKIQSFDKSTRMYTLSDEDVECDNIYTLLEKQVVVLNTMKGMDKNKGQKGQRGDKGDKWENWKRGDVVYAVYPDTTAFYQATVSQGARRLKEGSVGPGGLLVAGGGIGGVGGAGGVGSGTGGITGAGGVTGGGGAGSGVFVMVLFQDDGDERGLTHEKAVPVHLVMKVPPGAVTT